MKNNIDVGYLEKNYLGYNYPLKKYFTKKNSMYAVCEEGDEYKIFYRETIDTDVSDVIYRSKTKIYIPI